MDDFKPSLRDYLAIIDSQCVDDETKDLAREALRATLKAVPDLFLNLEKMMGSINK